MALKQGPAPGPNGGRGGERGGIFFTPLGISFTLQAEGGLVASLFSPCN